MGPYKKSRVRRFCPLSTQPLTAVQEGKGAGGVCLLIPPVIDDEVIAAPGSAHKWKTLRLLVADLIKLAS